MHLYAIKTMDDLQQDLNLNVMFGIHWNIVKHLRFDCTRFDLSSHMSQYRIMFSQNPDLVTVSWLFLTFAGFVGHYLTDPVKFPNFRDPKYSISHKTRKNENLRHYYPDTVFYSIRDTREFSSFSVIHTQQNQQQSFEWVLCLLHVFN